MGLWQRCNSPGRRRLTTDAVEQLIEPRPGPQAALEISQRDQGLQLALERLSDGQRQIIILRDYLDLAYAEIAEVLGKSQNTVASRYRYAMEKLQRSLESFVHDTGKPNHQKSPPTTSQFVR